MEIKFTPWRMHYIQAEGGDDAGCVLCTLHQADPSQDEENLVLCRGTHCYVVMNRYPYNTAHLMVAPYAHTADLPQLDGPTAEELFELVRQSVGILEQDYVPDGFNLGMNLGKSAGAGVDTHLHMHIVPRWTGDSNFMPIVGGTKLIPEELAQTYTRIRPHFDALRQE